jgi:hypothetical protein
LKWPEAVNLTIQRIGTNDLYGVHVLPVISCGALDFPYTGRSHPKEVVRASLGVLQEEAMEVEDEPMSARWYLAEPRNTERSSPV